MENFPVGSQFRNISSLCPTYQAKDGEIMNQNTIESNEMFGRAPARKKATRDADILVLLWDVFKTRANEIDQLLDLSLSILATADDFPQKTELEAALKKAISLIRT